MLTKEQLARGLGDLRKKKIHAWIRSVESVQLYMLEEKLNVKYHVIRRPKGFFVCPLCHVYEDFWNAYFIVRSDQIVCTACSRNERDRERLAESFSCSNEKPYWFVVDPLRLDRLVKEYMLMNGCVPLSPEVTLLLRRRVDPTNTRQPVEFGTL